MIDHSPDLNPSTAPTQSRPRALDTATPYTTSAPPAWYHKCHWYLDVAPRSRPRHPSTRPTRLPRGAPAAVRPTPSPKGHASPASAETPVGHIPAWYTRATLSSFRGSQRSTPGNTTRYAGERHDTRVSPYPVPPPRRRRTSQTAPRDRPPAHRAAAATCQATRGPRSAAARAGRRTTRSPAGPEPCSAARTAPWRRRASPTPAGAIHTARPGAAGARAASTARTAARPRPRRARLRRCLSQKGGDHRPKKGISLLNILIQRCFTQVLCCFMLFYAVFILDIIV